MKNPRVFKININLCIEVKSPKLKHIIESFKLAIIICFQSFTRQVLIYFANEYMKTGELARMLNCKAVVWKTSIGNEMTSIKTIFGSILKIF